MRLENCHQHRKRASGLELNSTIARYVVVAVLPWKTGYRVSFITTARTVAQGCGKENRNEVHSDI